MNTRSFNARQLRATLNREQAQPLAAGCAVVCAVVMVLLSGMPAGGQIIVAALIGSGIVFRVPACVHISLVITLILRGLPDNDVAQTSFGILDAVFGLATAGYVACVFRMLELDSRKIEDSVKRQWNTDPAMSSDGTGDHGAAPMSKEPAFILRPLSGLAAPIALACTAAVILLVVVALRNFWPNPFRMLPEALRAVVMIWLLAGAGAIAGIWLATRAWQKLSYDQFGVYIRRTLNEELKREMAPLELQRSRRLWRLYKDRRRRNHQPQDET